MRIRFLFIWLKAILLKKPMSTSEQSVLSFRVMPWDCVLRYMGNDRYHCFMDLGRMDLAMRLGWINILRKKRLEPQVTDCFVSYDRPLRLFDRFILRTYVIHIKGVSVWLAHYLEKDGTIHCSAISRLVAKSGGDFFRLDLFIDDPHLAQHGPFDKKVPEFINQGSNLLRKLSSGPF